MPPSSIADHVREAQPLKTLPRVSGGKVLPAIPFALSRSASTKKPGQKSAVIHKKQDNDVQHEINNGVRKDEVSPIRSEHIENYESNFSRSERRASVEQEHLEQVLNNHDETSASTPVVNGDRMQSERGLVGQNSSHVRPLPTIAPAASQRRRRFETSSISSNVHFSTRLNPHRLSGSHIVFGESETSSSVTPSSTAELTEATPQPPIVDSFLPQDASDASIARAEQPERETHYKLAIQPSSQLPDESSFPNQPQNGTNSKNGLDEVYNRNDGISANGQTRGAPFQNGHGRSDSQVSSVPLNTLEQTPPPFYPSEAFRAPATGPRHVQSASFARSNHRLASPVLNQMDVSLRIQNAESLQNHILNNFGDPSFSDCHLDVFEEFSGLRHQFSCHGLILSRSPTLGRLIQPLAMGPEFRGGFRADVRLSGSLLRTDVFVDALRYLYGGPLPMLDRPQPSNPGPDNTPTNEGRMRLAFQFIAMGHWLGLTAFGAHGVDLATSVLHWDTISTALAFALEGGLNSMWTADSNDDLSSPVSSEGRYQRAEMPTYDPFATDLLHRIIAFMVHMFPPNFYLDASASTLAELSPLSPTSDHRRPSRVDPRLSKIRFGDTSADNHQRPSFITTAVSSVLLSLPFPLLKVVLEHVELAYRLGPDTVSSVMRQVIAERESRRLKITTDSIGEHRHENGNHSAKEHWREFVEPSQHHRAGSRLVRRRQDASSPFTSETTSEWNR